MKLLVVLILAMSSSAATAQWKIAESAHFRVYTKGKEAAAIERAASLEDFRDLLISLTGVTPMEGAPRLDVLIVNDIGDASVIREVPKGVAGYYVGSPGRVLAVARSGELAGGKYSADITLHEYAHHFMRSNALIAYPAWYTEGWAEYVSTARFTLSAIEYGLPDLGRFQTLQMMPWLNLETVLVATPGTLPSSKRGQFYAQSWLLVHYLLRDPSRGPKLVAYLRAFAKDGDSLGAFRATVDPDIDNVEKALRTYTTSRDATYSRMARQKLSSREIKVQHLSPAAERLLLPFFGLELGGTSEQQASRAELVRKEAAKFADDPFARKVLALAELETGNRKRAAEILDGLMPSMPTDTDLLRWRARADAPDPRSATEEEARSARRLLARAFKIDPSDWRTLHLYAQLACARFRPLSDANYNVMMRALDLAPQVQQVVMDAAIAHVHRDDLPVAGALFTNLANDPHAGEEISAFLLRLKGLADTGDKASLLAKTGSLGSGRCVQ